MSIKSRAQGNLVMGSHDTFALLAPIYWKAQKTLMLHGTMGTGKSDAVRAFAMQKAKDLKFEFSDQVSDLNNEKKFLYIEIIAHLMDLGEIKGLAFPNEERTKTTYLPLEVFPTKGQGIIFFDEMNQAPPSVLNNLYQIILNKRVGNLKIADGFSFFAAGNMSSDHGHSFDIPPALNNRMGHMEFRIPNVEDWFEWASENQVDRRVISYLGYNPTALHEYREDLAEEVFAFATPRSWKFVSDLLIMGEVDDNLLKKSGAEIIGSMVSYGRAIDFVAFIQMAQHFDIAKIYKTGEFDVDTSDLGLLYSLQNALVGHYEVKAEKIKDKELNDLSIKAFDLAEKFPPESWASMLSALKSVDPEFLKRIKKLSPDKYKVMSKSLVKILV